jgi:hypothetical protein
VRGDWINESSFEKPAGLDMPKVVSSISETNQATGFGDTDGDGISDRVSDFIDPLQSDAITHVPVEWLAENELPTDHSEDHLDSDGDGASNWSEYPALTDPADPDSALAITEVTYDSPSAGEVTVVWNKGAGFNSLRLCVQNGDAC